MSVCHESAAELTEKRASAFAGMQATLATVRVTAAQIADMKLRG